MKRCTPLALLALGAAIAALAGLGAAARAADVDENFMPKGGRTLLLELLGPQPTAAEIRGFVAVKYTEPQWAEWLAQRATKASERERATLAAYLSVNMPLAAAKPPTAAELRTALPPDGRDLAWRQCQFCHSLFSSHLTQARDVQGWRNMFLSPFHREMKMTPQQREEFARYSALNMPMKPDDVPADLRF